MVSNQVPIETDGAAQDRPALLPVHRGQGGCAPGLDSLSNQSLLEAADHGVPLAIATAACGSKRNGVMLLVRRARSLPVTMELVKQLDDESS